ncbi:hypothetical protein Skr01_61920 [Sphaerisporangium krabiense]|nr:hypothetical protein Skr01_61920 [Sphaerisporangium krabiense]
MTVEERADGAGDRHLVAFVVPRERVLRTIREMARERRLDEWRAIYGSVYEAQAGDPEFGENFAEWKSGYDRLPIDRAQMEEWRARTVDTVLALRPRRVLEIGAGSGLILSRVAPRCESYWATDLSGDAVRLVSRAVARDPRLAEVVEVRHQPAHDFGGLPAGRFDTVVLNSVVQYFPDAGYLLDVLDGALKALAPGGVVVLGDIRNRRLRRGLYAAAELLDAGGNPRAESVRERIGRRELEERELLFDPEFFAALPAALGEIAAVDVRLKRGEHHNELTRHRYDVLLYRRPAEAKSPDGVERPRWGTEIADAASLEEYLSARRPAAMRLANIPNKRLAGEMAALRALDRGEPVESAVEKLAGTAVNSALDPETCHAIGARLGYEVRATWSAESPDGDFDVVFATGLAGDAPFVLSPPPPAPGTSPAREAAPLGGEGTAAFEKSLRAHLARVFENIPLPAITFVTTEEPPS